MFYVLQHHIAIIVIYTRECYQGAKLYIVILNHSGQQMKEHGCPVQSYSQHSKNRLLCSTIKNIWSLLSGPVSYDNQLSTKEARNEWEIEVSNSIIIPQLKVEMLLIMLWWGTHGVVLRTNAAWLYCRRSTSFPFCHLLLHSTWIDSWRKWMCSLGLTLVSLPVQ